MPKPRRQQGILTGMPFMANVAPRTFVDVLGRKLYLAKPPVRIISLAPSITETLFALGLDKEIIGVTEFCDFPAAATLKPKVGYSNPNLETLVALEPDLILAPKEFLKADLLARLEQLKIATFILQASSIEDIFSHMQTLGRMVGRPGEADTLTMGLRHRLNAVKQLVSQAKRPRVLYVLNSTPLMSVGPGSFIHQVIELAGGNNIASHAGAAYPRLSMESVIQSNPEWILFPSGSSEGIPEHEQKTWLRWTTLFAVQQGQLATIPTDLLNRPGPRIIDALETVAQIIHPTLFPADPSR